jgi:hypothetical protein
VTAPTLIAAVLAIVAILVSFFRWLGRLAMRGIVNEVFEQVIERLEKIEYQVTPNGGESDSLADRVSVAMKKSSRVATSRSPRMANEMSSRVAT